MSSILNPDSYQYYCEMSKEKKYFIISLLACIGILSYILFTAQAMSDYGDGISHYFISKYSWKHPILLLHLWGKPFFTFFSSFFTHFGVNGILVFNILCALFSSVCCYLIAKKFELKFLWAIPVLLCSTPVYFLTLNSGLTEPFFAFVLIASVALAVYQKNIWAAILLSFLPFVRSEGFLILPLFGLLYLLRKQYTAILFLAFGTILYSIIGWFVYGNLFWLVSQNPYNGAKGIYGTGTLFHFVERAKDIWGIAFTSLFCIGIIVFVYLFVKKYRQEKKHIISHYYTEEFLLVFGSFMCILIAHSLFWYLGIFSSLGLTRVLAATVPVAVLMAIRGFCWVDFISIKHRKFANGFIIIMVALCFIQPKSQHYIPFRLGGEETTVQKTADWFNKTKPVYNHLYYLHPYLTLSLDVDPHQPIIGNIILDLRKKENNYLQKNDIFIWDAHYCANEGGLPLDSLLQNQNLILLHKAVPDEAFKTIGNYPFEVYVFKVK